MINVGFDFARPGFGLRFGGEGLALGFVPGAPHQSPPLQTDFCKGCHLYHPAVSLL
jgi:hypothetical protein